RQAIGSFGCQSIDLIEGTCSTVTGSAGAIPSWGSDRSEWRNRGHPPAPRNGFQQPFLRGSLDRNVCSDRSEHGKREQDRCGQDPLSERVGLDPQLSHQWYVEQVKRKRRFTHDNQWPSRKGASESFFGGSC